VSGELLFVFGGEGVALRRFFTGLEFLGKEILESDFKFFGLLFQQVLDLLREL
jgi:hypothetical protein